MVEIPNYPVELYLNEAYCTFYFQNQDNEPCVDELRQKVEHRFDHQLLRSIWQPQETDHAKNNLLNGKVGNHDHQRAKHTQQNLFDFVVQKGLAEGGLVVESSNFG